MNPAIPLTFLAMAAFAANSLLARAALGGHAVDAPAFTVIRMVSGALALAVLLCLQKGPRALRARPGNWLSALSLFVYAIAFSLAYLRLGAATGALILFGSVQATMILWGLAMRDRHSAAEIAGLAIALAAFVVLLLPGLDPPDPLGSLLMIAAGIAWGVYTLRGRGAGDPLAETAGNFARAALVCLPLAAWAWAGAPHGVAITRPGVVLAVISGVVTSGIGYAIWYRALPHLSTIQAACVQLTVPILAAIGSVLFLSEHLTLHLVVCSLFLLGGVALAILSRRTRVGRAL